MTIKRQKIILLTDSREKTCRPTHGDQLDVSEHDQTIRQCRTDGKIGNDVSPALAAIFVPTESILEIMLRNNASQGKVQYTLMGGALSASISSQLIGAITSKYPVAGGIVHVMLLLACITGILTIATHFSSFTNDSAMTPVKRRVILAGSVLSNVSLWLTVFGIVVLAWVIQPQLVAIVVTVLFVLAVLAMIGYLAYRSRGKVDADHNA
ncbi:hypothetical protein BD410DRAFT_845766 [Rickenella mellea]|uniref:Uncharacterized protein n=1 Tax=Rickenella mellea TaxID=50990 RepID=A0A4Y7PIR0_9AGAM|nr:hypothetical protein BD410DRAFT_845766 [Rickenella mellea]